MKTDLSGHALDLGSGLDIGVGDFKVLRFGYWC